MTASSEPAATAPGRAAYEAEPWQAAYEAYAMAAPDEIEFPEPGNLPDREVHAWDAAAQAAIAAAQVADDTDMRDEMDQLRDLYDDLRDRIDSLALGLDMSARTTAPSRKSEIEAGCASALRGLLRTDGLVSKAGELREERDRLADALAGNPDPLVSALQSQVEHFRELIAEILDALDHGGPYYAEEWRERAGIEET